MSEVSPQTHGGSAHDAPPVPQSSAAHARFDASAAPLDRAMFPHIFERIVAVAPLSSQIVLRSVCRELRDHIDEALFCHVVATPPTLKAPARASGPRAAMSRAARGATQTAARDLELRTPAAPFSRLPFLPWRAAEPPGARKTIRATSRSRQLAHVSAIDFGIAPPQFYSYSNGDAAGGALERSEGGFEDYDDGFDDATPDEDSLRVAAQLLSPFLPFTRRLVVRRRHGLAGDAAVRIATRATTYVDYLAVTPNMKELEDRYRFRLCPPKVRADVPPVDDYVLHLAYDPLHPFLLAGEIILLVPPCVRTVTLVLHPNQVETDEAEEIVPSQVSALGFLRQTLRWLFPAVLRGAELNLVGLERTLAARAPWTIGYQGGTTADGLLEYAQSALEAELTAWVQNIQFQPHVDAALIQTVSGWEGPELWAAQGRMHALPFGRWAASLGAKGVASEPASFEPIFVA